MTLHLHISRPQFCSAVVMQNSDESNKRFPQKLNSRTFTKTRQRQSLQSVQQEISLGQLVEEFIFLFVSILRASKISNKATATNVQLFFHFASCPVIFVSLTLSKQSKTTFQKLSLSFHELFLLQGKHYTKLLPQKFRQLMVGQEMITNPQTLYILLVCCDPQFNITFKRKV